jgi:hypothetical protein
MEYPPNCIGTRSPLLALRCECAVHTGLRSERQANLTRQPNCIGARSPGVALKCRCAIHAPAAQYDELNPTPGHQSDMLDAPFQGCDGSSTPVTPTHVEQSTEAPSTPSESDPVDVIRGLIEQSSEDEFWAALITPFQSDLTPSPSDPAQPSTSDPAPPSMSEPPC